VLTDITLDVAPGEVIALVGPSGAGKSTMLALLSRFYDVDAGRVLLEGVEVRDLPPAALAHARPRVAQAPGLFSGPLRAHVGSAGFGGYAARPLDGAGGQGEGWRAGAFVPLTLALEVAGILEAWLGARLAFERVEGALAPSALNAPSSAWGLRGGGVVGLALGFRRLHVLAELAVDAEWWSGTTAGASFERVGVALTPALAVRVRL